MNRYSEYKKSGLQYFEEIPTNWVLKRLCDVIKKGQYSFTGGPFGSDLKSNDYTDEGVRIIQLQNIGVGNFLNDYKIYTSIEKANELYGCNIFPNDIIIAKMADPVARACIIPNIESRFLMASDGVRLVPNKNNFNKYLVYSINSIHFNFQAIVNSFGSTRLRIGLNTLKKLNIILPPVGEQTTISEYLDTKTHAIDKKIKLLAKKAEYYKELRKSIINNAVCKGLNKKVKLKESGIKWIGQIPEHWEVKRLKDKDVTVMGQSPSSDDYNYEFKGYPFLQGNADFDILHPLPSVWCELANKVINVNDILLSVRAPIGAINIANQKYGIGRGLCAIRAKKSFYKFLYYHLIARNADLNSFGTGTTYIAISLNDIINLLVVFPPFKEQIEIATYLDEKTQKIDAIVNNIGKQIETLKELRKTLINDVVTGKIRVSEL